ncbi:hypothetical protein BDW59DRAFT_181760 [Aspergillus cavernicola]|uniref:Actin-like ATPase domain-containing protein n=1 Tax=Aspergillus cavernicola TaxID=176166 RepID=A0ABR4HWH6_9EURO
MPWSQPILRRLEALSLQSSHKIIVGVDYGTTFTGASYVTSKGRELSDIVLISSWPGPSKDTETVFKAPSRIAYSADNPRINKDCWGYQVEPGMIAYSWTKLLLDQGTPLTQYDDPALENASETGILKLPEGKDAVQVVTDYLTQVYRHILKTISKNITEEALRITPIEFWFTVPAIWSDKAQNATKIAAHRAGFAGSFLRRRDKIFLISEPEAAAITALKKYTTGIMGGSVKTGDGVLICDCGGGTVCGSTAIDRNFYRLMSKRFGAAFDKLPVKRKSAGSEFMKRFEIIKRDFGNSDGQSTFELPLNMTVQNADDRYFDEEERLVIISSDDLRVLFDPVIAQIIRLVKQQLQDARGQNGKEMINRIVLVGGFGDSEYLRKAFRSSFGSTGKIAITVPDNPQAAIVQGAALRGLEGLRSATKRCRRHYGFDWGIHFRQGIDSEDSAFYDAYTGSKMASGVMNWIIKKGDRYADNHAMSIPVAWEHHPSWSLRKTILFHASDQTVAPERQNNKDVYSVGNIVVDFSNVDLSRFNPRFVYGTPVYHLKFELKVIFGAQEGVLKFEAISQGRTIGQTSIDFTKDQYY